MDSSFGMSVNEMLSEVWLGWEMGMGTRGRGRCRCGSAVSDIL